MRLARLLALVTLWSLWVPFGALAQNGNPAGLPPVGIFSTVELPLLTNLPPVQNANVAVVGNPGNGTYYYWLVTNYTFGQAPVQGPFIAINAPTVLSGTKYVTITPDYLPGATIDVLKTTSLTPPSGTGNYALSTGNSSGTINDQGGALSSYTLSPANPSSQTNCLSTQVVGSGAAHLYLTQGNDCQTFVADLTAIGTSTGTVTNFTSGSLVPLFTTSIANPTTTPALTFSLTNAAAYSAFGNFTNASAAPGYSATPTINGLTLNTSLTLGFITGSAQCLHVNTSGVVSGAGSDCGSGGGISGSGTTGNFAGFTGSTAIGNAPGTFTTSGGFNPNITLEATNSSSFISALTLNPGTGTSHIDWLLQDVAGTPGTGNFIYGALAGGSFGINPGVDIGLSQSSLFSIQGYNGTSEILLAQLSSAGYWKQVSASGNVFTADRNTDISPTGNFLQFLNAAANSTLFQVDVLGDLTMAGTLTVSALGGSTQCLESVAGVVTGTGAACGSGGSLPSGNQGTELINTSSGSGATYSAQPYTIHTYGGYASLAAAVATCPASPAPCKVVIDPQSATLPIQASGTSTPLVIGSQTQYVDVEDDGTILQAIGTTGSDNIDLGYRGHLRCTGAGNGGSAVGCTINSSTGANITSLVTNTTQDGTQGNFDLQGFDLVPATAATITKAALWMVAIEGQGHVENIGIVGGSHSTNLLIQDGPATGDSEGLVFSNVNSVCSGKPCVALNIQGTSTGTGRGANITFVGGSFVDGGLETFTINSFTGTSGTLTFATTTNSLNAGDVVNLSAFTGGNTGLNGQAVTVSATGLSTTQFEATVTGSGYASGAGVGTMSGPCVQGDWCLINIDGAAGAGGVPYLSGVTLINPYLESHPGQAGSFIEANNVRGLDIRTAVFDGGPELTNCVIVSETATTGLGVVDVTGRQLGTRCINNWQNTVTAQLDTSHPDISYHYPGYNGLNFIDGPANVNGLVTLLGATSGSATIGASVTGSLLDLNGTNATVSAAGAASFATSVTVGSSGAGTVAIGSSGGFTTTLGSVATANNTFDFPAAVFANGDLGYCAVSSTTCTWTDAGYAFNAIPLADLATVAANTTLANVTGSTAHPTAAAIPSGIQNYVAGTGYNQATAHQLAAPRACADSSGSGTAQSCTTSPSFTPALGDEILYTTTTANTGALTVNVNSSAADAVQKWQGTALASGDIKANIPVLLLFDGTHWQVQNIGNAPSGGAGGSLDQITGAAAQATGTETAAGHNYTFAGVETTNLTAPISITNANSTNNNTSVGFMGGVTGTSTGGIGELIYDVSGTGDIARWYHGGSVSNGTYTVGTLEMDLANNGNLTINGFLITGGIIENGTYEGAAGSSNVVYQGGQDGAGSTGGSWVRGANNTTVAGTGNLLIESPGLLTGASPTGTPGLREGASQYLKGTTVTQWNVQCMTTTAFTTADCPASATAVNILGIASNATNGILVIESGLVPINATAAVTIGDTVCLSSSTAGKVTDSGGTGLCSVALQTIGTVVATSGSTNAASGSTNGGASVTFTTTLPLVKLIAR